MPEELRLDALPPGVAPPGGGAPPPAALRPDLLPSDLLPSDLLPSGVTAHAVYAIPMRQRFRGITVREGLLLRGPAGWAEFCPFPDYDPGQCRPWLDAALEAAQLGWPAPVRDSVPVNGTVPAVDAATAAAIVRSWDGCRTAKVKVAEPGQTLADDVARVEAVRDALGPTGRVRVDANGGWTLDEAVRAVRALDRFGLEYVEQPCRTVEELAALRRRVDVPVAADESIRRSEDPMRVVRAEAADIAVLKVQPLGGVRACLEIAERIGLPVVVSSALESSVGLAAGVALAAALPELPYACGLGTVTLLTTDVVARPLAPVGGRLPAVRTAPAPEAAALAAVAAPEETVRHWGRRLAATAAVRRAPDWTGWERTGRLAVGEEDDPR
ncbi:o-succinylbenzoate synthase [Allostreptomyces psammosilenae]|uniref:o-succinylbenzoate synthase n=1 Tax=Allostreptomyces psammosilenae TaxID=1892865 RepID=A0A853A5I6_9ACTN|nr:o-succinylbenzoate synthase [Allostreptomyces psammosilenae]NYI05788.1 O-succinylbenzoate synthase [Allostreptomyces psammosilenae]